MLLETTGKKEPSKFTCTLSAAFTSKCSLILLQVSTLIIILLERGELDRNSSGLVLEGDELDRTRGGLFLEGERGSGGLFLEGKVADGGWGGSIKTSISDPSKRK